MKNFKKIIGLMGPIILVQSKITKITLNELMFKVYNSCFQSTKEFGNLFIKANNSFYELEIRLEKGPFQNSLIEYYKKTLKKINVNFEVITITSNGYKIQQDYIENSTDLQLANQNLKLSKTKLSIQEIKEFLDMTFIKENKNALFECVKISKDGIYLNTILLPQYQEIINLSPSEIEVSLKP